MLAIAQSPIIHSPIATLPPSKEKRHDVFTFCLRWGCARPRRSACVKAGAGWRSHSRWRCSGSWSGRRKAASGSSRCRRTSTPSVPPASKSSRTTWCASPSRPTTSRTASPIDKYRIAKRVEPGRPIVFEFRADQPGRFPDLLQSDGRRAVQGDGRRADCRRTLIERPKLEFRAPVARRPRPRPTPARL